LPALPLEWYRRGWPDDKHAAVEVAARNERLRSQGKSIPPLKSSGSDGSAGVPVDSTTGSELSAMASPYTGVKAPPDLAGDDRIFGPAHRRVVEQVLASGTRKTLLDIGAGTGLSTACMLEACPAAQVFAVDLWHSPFAGDQLRSHGHRDLGSLLGATPRAYEAFCLRLEDDTTKLPSGSPLSALGGGGTEEDEFLGGGSIYGKGVSLQARRAHGTTATGAAGSSGSGSVSASTSTGVGEEGVEGLSETHLTVRQRLVPMRYPMQAALKHLRSIGM